MPHGRHNVIETSRSIYDKKRPSTAETKQCIIGDAIMYWLPQECPRKDRIA